MKVCLIFFWVDNFDAPLEKELVDNHGTKANTFCFVELLKGNLGLNASLKPWGLEWPAFFKFWLLKKYIEVRGILTYHANLASHAKKFTANPWESSPRISPQFNFPGPDISFEVEYPFAKLHYFLLALIFPFPFIIIKLKSNVYFRAIDRISLHRSTQ